MGPLTLHFVPLGHGGGYTFISFYLILFPNSSLLLRVLAEGFKRVKAGKKTHRGWAARVAGPPVRNVAKIFFLFKIGIFDTGGFARIRF